MKRLFSMMLAVCLLFAAAVPVFAAETVETTGGMETTEAGMRDPDQCGETMYWSYADGVLTISGSGEMDDFLEGAPWTAYQDELKKVVIEGEVTKIGAFAFKYCSNLEEVDVGDALYEIGAEAFMYCDSLTAVYLPKTFKIFGESCFESCKNLTEIHSEGVFPSFRQNCLWDTYAKIYFPKDRPWNVELIEDLEEAFNGRIEFLASDGSDPFVPTEPVEETEETEPETTPPTTEAPTQPVVTETVAETTEAVQTTALETGPSAPAESTGEAGEEPETVEEDGVSGILVGSLIICGVLTFFVLGALIFRRGTRGGKYSK